MMNYKHIAAGVFVLAILGAVGNYARQGVIVHQNTPHRALSGGDSSHSAVNYKDDRVMVGVAHYVFVGKVIKIVGSRLLNGLDAATQFDIEPVLNIKGELKSNIVLNQAGVSYYNGKLTSYGGDDLLHIGATYVFAATYDRNGNFAIAIPEYDRALITDDTRLSTDQLKDLSEQNERVIAFKNAYPNEILPRGEVERNTAWNSYKSLQSGHLLTPPPLEPASAAPANNPASADTPTTSPADSVSPTPTPVDSTAPTDAPADATTPTPASDTASVTPTNLQ